MTTANRATRATAAVGVATMALMGTVGPAAAEAPPPDRTALLVCGATCPAWPEDDIPTLMELFITPTHPGETIEPVAVTAPGEAWPLTGLLRLLGRIGGDPRFFGPGGAAWPDLPWWKLTGLFDLTADESLEAGAANLEAAMAAYGNDHLVIYGMSQGAATANVVRNRLVAQYPEGTTAPDIDFVLQGDINVPNGGQYARFPGLHIPILGWTSTGAEPTDTQFDTVVISSEYDGFADFPLYPLNVISLLNALMGIVYVHAWPFDVSLPADDPTTSPAYQGTVGRTSYYLFETEDLPLFGPLRQLGVPEAVIDVFEPFFKVIVDLGYDRTIPPWEPTPARLVPQLDVRDVISDLVGAIREGAHNAAELIGLPKPPATSESSTLAAPSVERVQTDSARQEVSTKKSDETEPSTEQQTLSDSRSNKVTKDDEADTKKDEELDETGSETPRPVVRESFNASEPDESVTTDESPSGDSDPSVDTLHKSAGSDTGEGSTDNDASGGDAES